MTISRNTAQLYEYKILRHPIRVYFSEDCFKLYELKAVINFLATSSPSEKLHSISYDFRYKQFLDIFYGDCDEREPEYDIDYKLLLNQAIEIIHRRRPPQDQLIVVQSSNTVAHDTQIADRWQERREWFETLRFFTSVRGLGTLYTGHPIASGLHSTRIDFDMDMMLLEQEHDISFVTPDDPQTPLVFDFFDDTQPDLVITLLNTVGIPTRRDNEGNIGLREDFSISRYTLRTIGSYLLSTLYGRLNESGQLGLSVSLVLYDIYYFYSHFNSRSHREIPSEHENQSIVTRISNSLYGLFSSRTPQVATITPPQLRR